MITGKHGDTGIEQDHLPAAGEVLSSI